jgi:hypothetical protein
MRRLGKQLGKHLGLLPSRATVSAGLRAKLGEAYDPRRRVWAPWVRAAATRWQCRRAVTWLMHQRLLPRFDAWITFTREGRAWRSRMRRAVMSARRPALWRAWRAWQLGARLMALRRAHFVWLVAAQARLDDASDCH